MATMLRRSVLWLVAATLSSTTLAAPVDRDFTDKEVKTIGTLALSALPPLPPDPTNRFADQAVPAAFGATLFFEERLSRDGSVSCATCHQIDSQFQDDLPQAVALGHTTRRTMPLAGVAHNTWFFWDGRRDSLWAQALVPLERSFEHGGTRTYYAHVMADELRDRYEHAFGPLPDLSGLPKSASPLGNAEERAAWQAMSQQQREDVNTVFANLGKAFAAFERSIVPEPTRFDRFADALASGKAPDADTQMSAQEINGLKLFIGKANCVSCHNGPRFTDGLFHNTGVPGVAGLPPDIGRERGLGDVQDDPFNCFGRYRDGDVSACEKVRVEASDGASFRRAFKTPSLRGAAARPPYMHAGQLPTLEAVIDHYNIAPASVGGVSEVHPLGLSEDERAALVAFLKTLSD